MAKALTTAKPEASLTTIKGTMKRIRLAFVGGCKTGFFAEACDHYLRALERYVKVDVLIARDAKSGTTAERLRKEGQGLLAGLGPRDHVVGLEEDGRRLDSKGLAAWLEKRLEDPGKNPCLVIGGPYGFSPEIRERFADSLSLGPYTLPHELARVLLLEQLYRAATILAGHPYHH